MYMQKPTAVGMSTLRPEFSCAQSRSIIAADIPSGRELRCPNRG